MEQNHQIQAQQKKDYSLSLTVEKAIQDINKIHSSSDVLISTALSYSFALIGLSDQHHPKGLTRTFLIDFIRKEYKFFSVDEIKMAFTMLVKGELSESPKHYNNFSPEYFGSVMKLYKIHRDKAQQDIACKKKVAEMDNEKQYVPDSITKQQRQMEFDKTVIMPIFEKYKQFGIIDLGFVQPHLVYNSLTGANKIIEFDPESKKQIYENAKLNLKERAEQFKKMKATSYKEHKNKIQAISELIDLDSASNEIVKESHLICIKLCFDKMIEQNIRL